MRTKTLLVAVTALAAGLFTSQAAVTSANIVGYANIQFGANFNMMECPFQVGASNGANEIFGTNLPDFTVFNIWDPNTSTFSTAVFDTGGGFNTPPYWFAGDDVTPIPIPKLPVGVGFFIQPPTPITNTFVGAVAAIVGNTATNHLLAAFNLAGSKLPYAGSVTNNAFLNLTTNLPDFTVFNIWNPNTSTFSTVIYDTGGGFNTPPYWYAGDDVTPVPPPVFTVGQAFFVQPPSPVDWVQSLTNN